MAVERVLPAREWLDAPAKDDGPGGDCLYYRSHGDMLRAELDIYRLCFGDGRLIAKDAIARP